MISIDPFFAMSSYWYEQWYKNNVSPNLSRKQKMDLIKKINKLALREPIFHGGLYYPKEDFPELAPYVSPGISKGKHPFTEKEGELTGVQLYAVYMAAAKELGFPTTLGSTYKGKQILPDLPKATKRYIHRKKPEAFEIKKKTKKKIPGIPELGTDAAPSIENRAGCSQVNGKWLDNHNICLLSDGHIQGYTAPIKGIYFYWSKEPTWEVESLGACHVYGDDFYPKGIGTCKSKIEFKFSKKIADPRRMMLQIAGDIMRGKGKKYGIMCTTPNGRPVGCSAHNAVAGNNPVQIKKLYDNIKLEGVKPFRLRK